ncbi:MAG: BspA family leucine-rich repeat surface protein, partial [Bacteroides sp.]
MKQNIFLAFALGLALLLPFGVLAQASPFITRWKAEAGKELKIPIFGTNYKLVIKKASDNTELVTEASLTITANENFYTYTPTEDGDLLVEAGPEGVEYIRFVDDKSKRGSAADLLTVEQFGTVVWKTMEEAFQYCKNMQFAATVDTPDLSNVTSMSYTFYKCSSFNQDLSSWNVSNMTNMECMFLGCSSFNQDLSRWNVSNVTNMEYMFSGCSSFNQDLSRWNVSNVTNMEYMFYNCSSFNQDLSRWNVSNVTNMEYMFYNCSSFNQDLSRWNVSNVTNMEYMFYNCSSFNQDLSRWNVSNVTNMEYMF